MPSKKLSRTTYREHDLPGNPVRTGDVARGEAALDMDEYYRPLEQVHGSGAHGWGIADGLRVTATLNQANVNILPGIAIDAQGRHIALAEGGNAEIGSDADVLGTPSTLTGVSAGGATMLTKKQVDEKGKEKGQDYPPGNYYVTIQWWEALDTDAYHDYAVYRINHVPWIRLLQIGGFADVGSRLVLARISLGAGGIVTGMSHELRRSVSLPAQIVRLRKAVAASGAPNFAVDNAVSGEIRARTAGGMELAVPAAADEIHLLCDGGNFAKLAVAANEIAARRSDGKESVVIDTQHGNITAGTQGVEGDILVKDANNRLVITLDGDDAVIVVGAAGNEGDILVKDSAGQDAVRVDGNTGNIFTKRITPTAGSGSALDVDARLLRIHGSDLCLDGRSGGNKRALVDLGNRLAVNYGTDYANGVDIRQLHLSDHIKGDYWEATGEWNPGRYQWHTLYEVNTRLLATEWKALTTCEIGMYDKGSVNHFWWQTVNFSYTNDQGQIVIKWLIQYGDDGTDWFPWQRSVTWIAFRL